MYLAATATVQVDIDRYQVDVYTRMVLINQPIAELHAQQSAPITTIALGGSSVVLQLVAPVDAFALRQSYTASYIGLSYQVQFTDLPLAHIDPVTIISNEPRRPASFVLATPEGNVTHTWIGVELKGATTIHTNPKKSYRLECWSDQAGTESVDYTLLGMRSDDDWDLHAMYHDHMRLRTPAVAAIWGEMARVYYRDDKPDAQVHVRTEYLELFVNGRYHGIYALGERIDRKLLKLKKYKPEEDLLRGQLTKAIDHTARHMTPKPYNNYASIWNGQEYRYPDDKIDWEPLYDLYDFVANASDTEFELDHPLWFDTDNAADFYILLNAMYLTDNHGKNNYYARRDNDEPWMYVPHDLGGSLAIAHTGIDYDFAGDTTTNRLFERLLQDCSEGGFQENLQNRWWQLRHTTLHYDSVKAHIESRYQRLSTAGVYQREAARWPDSYMVDSAHIAYTYDWLDRHLTALDTFFAQQCPVTLYPIDTATTPVDTSGTVTAIIPIATGAIAAYPNPTSRELHVRLPAELHAPTYRLYDIQGRLHATGRLVGDRGIISMASLPRGVYWLEFTSQRHSGTVKVMRE